ncbi:restriction endonuclease subunit R [Moraxellaceae bacterium AER2_44_116]|nr:restriction endonuclease subunit R [Moraxellaceae bacterium AER2_44_116]
MALTLKTYQTQALTALESFFIDCRVRDAKAAFERAVDYDVNYVDRLVGVPSICLRVPTGGGKTLIAAHSIAVAANHYLNSNAPIVLWLVPSDMIRQQTLKALADVTHPYRQAAMQRYGDRIKVCDLDGLQTINPNDVGKSCLIIVTTSQAFNITKTEKRNVYAFFEELSPHFSVLTPQQEQGMERVTAETIKEQPHLTASDIGRVKHSLANWFHLHRPIIVLDEAHKNRSKLSFETFARLNPACLVELTATPRDNNVLYSVSAAELKSADMIKLPVVLTEHPDGWQSCLRDALLQRQQLELDAQKDPSYIRPILLVQAQPKGGEATVDVVRAHLIQHENVPEEQIAVSTGTTKELNDINLFAPSCPIRVVITVEALKEGWDCSFAYVLASLQNMNSAVDVEQLLGRVLRMPYAQKRPVESLNKAYAHVIAESVAQAASQLKDRMVANMGFNKWEADLAIQKTLPIETPQGQGRANIVPELALALPHAPDTTHFSEEVKQAIQILPNTQGATLLIKKGTNEDTFKQIESFVVQSAPPKKQEQVQAAFNDARAERQAQHAGENWNASFAPIPQLCLFLDGEWQVVEKEVIENAVDLDLLNYPLNLAFNIRETAHSFEIDMNMAGESVTYRQLWAEQLTFNEMRTNNTETDLVLWLDKQVRHTGLTQVQLRAYLVKLVGYLLHERKLTLTALIRSQFQLRQAVRNEIERLFELARSEAFQSDLFGKMTVAPQPETWQQFEFKAGIYPVRKPYRGSYEFGKHFYQQIDDLREKTKDGKNAEEFSCAQVIDMHPRVKHWVRNISQQRETSFWFPTAKDYFYPDFVCELDDGSIAVIEYKGEVYVSNDDSKEKEAIGKQWANNSQGKRIFLMARSKADDGRDVYQQIHDAFAK